MPTRLWSAVVSQLPIPVLADGRRMRLPSATAVAISSPSALSRPLDTSSRILPLFTRALEGASGLYPGPLRALGLVPQPSAQRLQVGNQGRDLVVGEAQVGH